MKTRIGKIARQPRAIRNQLNQRLHDGEPGQRLLEWLNALPEVQAVLAAEFEGRPVNAQNLSDWKKGGYREWVLQQEALELAERLAEDAVELQAEGRPLMSDTLALWLVARYAVATRAVSAQDGPEQWRQLRELCADVVELRRGDHSAERLRLERAQWEAACKRTDRERFEEFWKWASDPEIRETICRGFMTNAEKIAAMRKTYFADVDEFMASEKGKRLIEQLKNIDNPRNEKPPPETPESNQGESSPIKRDQAGEGSPAADPARQPPTDTPASIQGESSLIKPEEKPCDCPNT